MAAQLATFMQDKLTPTPPDAYSSLKVGDSVQWENKQGAVFTNKVIGFDTDEFFLDTDAYWSGFDNSYILKINGKQIRHHSGLTNDLTLNNGQTATYSHTDWEGKPCYELESGLSVCCVELNGTYLHTYSHDGEACTPLKQEYQPRVNS